jgi:hypothetical protein
MGRRAVAVLVVAIVLLAGCLGGPTGSNSDTTPTPTEQTPISSADVPGVSNGSLTNATALARANEAILVEQGAVVDTSYAEDGEATRFQLRLGAGGSTYTLSGAYPAGGGQSSAVDIWSNDTSRFVRTDAGNDTQYRVVARDSGLPNTIRLTEDYLQSGQFTVQNDSRGDGTLVLTADEVAPSTDRGGPFSEPSAYSGRLVVDGDGLIQNLTVSAADEGRSVTYRYGLVETGVDSVSAPDWVADIPAGATLDPQLEVTLENESYLAIRHQGGDAVPRNSTLRLTMNETTSTATFGTELGDGDVRVAYVSADSGELRLVDQRPSAEVVDPLSSPISVSLVTDGGVTLHSGGMGWESGSASAGGGSSGNSSERSG